METVEIMERIDFDMKVVYGSRCSNWGGGVQVFFFFWEDLTVHLVDMIFVSKMFLSLSSVGSKWMVQFNHLFNI